MVDESAQHAGHAGARETDSPSGETHFRVALVSPEFEGLPTIKRHRLVYQARACVCRVNAVPVCYLCIAFCHEEGCVSILWHATVPEGILDALDRS